MRTLRKDKSAGKISAHLRRLRANGKALGRSKVHALFRTDRAERHAERARLPALLRQKTPLRQKPLRLLFRRRARGLLHDLKYRNGTYALYDLAKIAAQFPEAGRFIDGAILVPVPLHFLRKIKRKYNQSELIAKMFADTFPNAKARVADILKRKRRTPTQTTLDKEERETNIKNAFEIRGEKYIRGIPKDANIVIVDDVMTSGATLSECAKILKRAGFKNVSALAFARRL